MLNQAGKVYMNRNIAVAGDCFRPDFSAPGGELEPRTK